MLSLYIRNIVFFILQPGLVVGFIPYILLRGRLKIILAEDFNVLSYLGIGIMILGLAIVIYCIYRFIVEGKGTLSPADRTKTLVVRGLYKYTRNPMYVGILVILLSEIILIKSMTIFAYTVIVGLSFHLFVIFVEEPRLKKDFKNDYALYSSRVNRWF